MSAGRFLKRTLRGFRLVEIGALTVVLALALAVYLVKARAGRETGDITAVENQIQDEQRRIRLLQAEMAGLERPDRIERLSADLGLGPTADKREAPLDRLPELARQASLSSEAGKAPAKTDAATTQAGALR